MTPASRVVLIERTAPGRGQGYRDAGGAGVLHLRVYAHDYERGLIAHPDEPPAVAGGLDFQSEDVPDYFDFVYFAFIIGVASQTADVVIKGRQMRRVATLHGVFSFFFNTTVLALAVNLASSAF